MNAKLLVGDAMEQLATLADASVQCVVTSPPYWGLRDYSACGCAQRRNAGVAALEMAGTITLGASGQSSATDPRCRKPADPDCPACGGSGQIIGTQRQIGLEATPELFVAKMVEVFREVRRVLRGDGTLWLNMGDCYSAGGRGGNPNGPSSTLEGGRATQEASRVKRHRRTGSATADVRGWSRDSEEDGGARVWSTLPAKNILGMPWRVAFALQADGWYLRQDIIWHKASPMPESVTDRCTKAHDYLFLMTKSERYYYDAQAIAEPLAEASVERLRQSVAEQHGSERANGGAKTNGTMKAVAHGEMRNRRSVWTIASQPFKEAHFATFPPKLVEPCILAGTSAMGCCSACGAPLRRVSERKALKRARPNDVTKRNGEAGTGNHCANTVAGVAAATKGWDPTCQCGAAPRPCVVLDPFAGAGTTLLVADRLGRDALGIELNPVYAAMARRRIAKGRELFSGVEAAGVVK